jgi:hypothetical protein
MKTLLIILSLFFSIILNAQTFSECRFGYPDEEFVPELKDLKLDYPIIFEGEIMSQELGFIDMRTHISTPYIVNVTRVIKGEEYLKLGTIQILRGGGYVRISKINDVISEINVGIEKPSALPLSVGKKGIFFAYLEELQEFKSPNINGLVNDLVLHPSIFKPYFGREAEYFSVLGKAGLNVPFEYSLEKIQKDDAEAARIAYNEKAQQEYSERMTQLNEIRINYDLQQTDKLNAISKLNPRKRNKAMKLLLVDTILNIQIVNPIYTFQSDTAKYLEFDIQADASHAKYFDNCLVWLKYDTTVFGSNVAQNGNVTITKGTNFNSSTYRIYTPADLLPNRVAIPFGTDYIISPLSRTLLGTAPQILYHVKLKVKNCAATASVQFDSTVQTSVWSSYAQTANASVVDVKFYTKTNYTDASPYSLCAYSLCTFRTLMALALIK